MWPVSDSSYFLQPSLRLKRCSHTIHKLVLTTNYINVYVYFNVRNACMIWQRTVHPKVVKRKKGVSNKMLNNLKLSTTKDHIERGQTSKAKTAKVYRRQNASASTPIGAKTSAPKCLDAKKYWRQNVAPKRHGAKTSVP